MRKFFSRLCFILAAVVLVVALIYYWPQLIDYLNNIITYNDIRDTYTADPEDPDDEDEITKYLKSLGLDPAVYAPVQVDSEGLLAENEDYIGWIYVPRTSISYPVVRADDNDEYLHADFHKEYNFAGTIFLDAYCDEGLDNHHTILYGHNMRVGTMFAGLNKFRDQEYAEERPLFWFITPEEYRAYIIFAINTPNPYDRLQYGVDGFDFMTDEEYAECVEAMMNGSVITPSIEREVTTDDYIMSLSTCTGDSSVRCKADGILDASFDVATNHTFVKETETETEYEY